MANIKQQDRDGRTIYMKHDGTGSNADPFIPYQIATTETEVIADENNIMSEYVKNNGSEDQNVDGSTTPVTFSTTVVPAGKAFLAARVIIYMEGDGSFDSNKFGNLTALTNGWTLAINGVEAMFAKTNRELVSYMFDAHGSKIFGKMDRTFIGRFSFNKFTKGAVGLCIKAGHTLDTIVKDDLSGLSFLTVMVQGMYVDM